MRSLQSFVFLLLIACPVGSSQQTEGHPPSFIVASEATKVSITEEDGIQTIQYELKEPYPAQSFIQFLKDQLLDKGWTLSEQSQLHPDLPTSSSDWVLLMEPSVDFRLVTQTWRGEWWGPDGEVSIYQLRYAYREGTDPDLDNLTVIGTHIPKDLVEEIRSRLHNADAGYGIAVDQQQEEYREEIDALRASVTKTGTISLRVVKSINKDKEDTQTGNLVLEDIEFDDRSATLEIDVVAALVKNDQFVGASIDIIFSAQGAESMRAFTRQNLNKRIAILVGERVVATPFIRGEISDSATIAGDFSEDEASKIADDIMNQ